MTEMQIQRAVFEHLRRRGAPGIFCWHPFSGGYRKPREAAIYKGLGAIAGLPDVMVLHNGKLFAIELKREGGQVSAPQLATMVELREAGAIVGVAVGLDEAIRKLEAWGLLRGKASLSDSPGLPMRPRCRRRRAA
jgi:hypothetical protein